MQRHQTSNNMAQVLVLPTFSMQNSPYQPIIGMKRTVSPLRTSPKNDDKQLRSDFQPGPFDVICSQGRTAKSHSGNIFFHMIIKKSAKEYANAIEKRVKSKIVRNIIETIESKSPDGGFVKKDSDGMWRVVTLEQAREKVSQSLRDTLAGRYRSSLIAKRKSRMESNLKRMIDFDEIIGANKFVTDRMQLLSETIQNTNDSSNANNMSDSNILKQMTETNDCILQQLKKDHMVQQKVHVGQSQQQVENSGERKPAATTSFCAVDETLQMFHTDRKFMLTQPPSKR